MRQHTLNDALAQALPNEKRATLAEMLASLESIESADRADARQASVVGQAVSLSNTLMKLSPDDTVLHEHLGGVLTQLGKGTGVEVVSTEGLTGILSSLSGFFKTRKPNGELPSRTGDYRKREAEAAKFFAELDKTYLNSTWLSKQTFITDPVKAGDISTHFVIDGALGNKPFDNIETAKKRVQDFISKWEPVLKDLNGKVKSIDQRVKAETKGAALDDEAAIQKVAAAVKEFATLPDPMNKLPKMQGTGLGNLVLMKGKDGDLVATATTAPTSAATLPPLSKEEVMVAAKYIKQILKFEFDPEMERFGWLDHSDGSAFNDWIYDADYDVYSDYYDLFYHQTADQLWVEAVDQMFSTYPLASALLNWIDRSIK